MRKKELKDALASFDNYSGAKIKYFLAKSIFPEQTDQELKEITGINARHFANIKSAFADTSVPLLKFDNPEELDSLYAELEDQQRALHEAAEEIQNLTKGKGEVDSAELEQLRQELKQTKQELASLKANHALTDALVKDYQKKYTEEIDMNRVYSVDNQYYRFLLEKNGITIDSEVLAALENGETTMDELRKKSKGPKLVKI